MDRPAAVPSKLQPAAHAGSSALGLVLLAAGLGVAVVHLVLAPAAFLLQRRARRASAGEASTSRGEIRL